VLPEIAHDRRSPSFSPIGISVAVVATVRMSVVMDTADRV
jgi:hypothetical protein